MLIKNKDTEMKELHFSYWALTRFCLLLAGALSVSSLSAQSTSIPADDRIGVSTISLDKIWIQPLRRVMAEAVSLNHTQISAQATGEVLKIEVEAGDTVEKDATLVTLDCRQSELSAAVFKDVLDLARKEYRRAQSLQKTNTIAEQELTRLQSTLEQARIHIQQSELDIEHCLVKAPFSGVITQRQVQLGMIANPGSPMLKLIQTDSVEVSVYLNAEQWASLQASSDIRFSSGSDDYPVKLRSALPVVNPASNKRSVRLQFTQMLALPGTAGEVVWPAATKHLPVDFIVEREGQLGYFIVEDQRAQFIALPNAVPGHPAALGTSIQNAQDIEVVVEGRFRLTSDDQVVVRGVGE